jgi:CRISPR/Cas system-associated endoribonuclease Cas2
MPAAKIRTLESDGCVRVQVGEFVGTVSSMHLVEPKILQLQEYWRKVHQP